MQEADPDTGLTRDEVIAETVLERWQRGVPMHMLIVGNEAPSVVRILARSLALNDTLLAQEAERQREAMACHADPARIQKDAPSQQ